MSYIALYRKWRPTVFEDVVEQEHVVKTLKHSVSTGRIAHAYLFCGTRGTGKTTMAHIMSRAINCLNTNDGNPCNECEICKGILSGSILDVLEIDAASNNSVDNIRDIRDEVVYAPSRAKYKVYIIDEVHMLSSGAFNALLKTLEEPPSHVVFILATTEPHKLPATILSRCQKFDFRRISIESIMHRLETIAVSNSTTIHSDALKLIARMSDGALRDAISLLDQCISLGNSEITYTDVLAVVGIVNDTFIADTVDAVNRKDINTLLNLIDELVMDGKDILKFVSDLVYYYRNLLICKIADKPQDIIEASPDIINTMKNQCDYFNEDEIIYIIKELSLLESDLKWAVHPRILLEVALIKLCENTSTKSTLNFDNSILERLSALENRLSDAAIIQKPASQPIIQEVGMASNTVKEKSKTAYARTAHTDKKNSDSFPPLEIWGKVLLELKSMGRMAIYACLIDTKAVELDDKFIGIIFTSSNRFNKMNVSKAENLEVIEQITCKLLGRDKKIKCLDENSLGEKENIKTNDEKDEFVQKAQDIANKLNVPFNIIDD